MLRTPTIVVLLIAMASAVAAGGEQYAAVDSAVAVVRARVAAAGEECEITVATLPTVAAGLDSWSALRVESLPTDRLGGLVTVWVSGTVPDGSRRRAAIGLHVRTFDTVLVATHLLARHTAPGETDVEGRRVETTTLPEDVLRSRAAIGGLRMNRVVATGTILHRTMLEELPVVRSGDRVTVVARSGGVRLSVPGTARQDGCVGSNILVQREGAHARVLCRVVDAGTVEVRAK